MSIPIAEAKRIREKLGATHLVLFAIDQEGSQVVATHGQTTAQAKEAAAAGNKLKAALGWPTDLCQAKPLDRTCGNCAYFQKERGTFYMNSGYDERVYGHCMAEPKPIGRAATDCACLHFEPNQ